MTMAEETSCVAFVSCWANAIHELPIRFPNLQQSVDNALKSQPAPAAKSLAHHLQLAYTSLPLSPAWNDNQGMALSLHDLSQKPKKLQHRLTEDLDKLRASVLVMEDAGSACDPARIRSLQSKGAGAWLESVPTSGSFAMDKNEFQLAAFLRLGQPMPFSSCISHCNCGASLDIDGYHLLTCKLGGGPVWEHNILVSEWCECLRDLQLHHRKEPRNLYINNEDRPDIIVYDTGVGANVELDFSLAHPFSKDTVNQAAKEERFAATKREEKKIQKYSNQERPGLYSPTFKPLVFEHFGCWGKQAESYLNQLARRMRDQEGRSNEAQFIQQ